MICSIFEPERHIERAELCLIAVVFTFRIVEKRSRRWNIYWIYVPLMVFLLEIAEPRI